ncbi:hypothetical protein BGZ61DRAFT_72120 [Ilyonectria robusta]|uniref:uncharacterized protein n=1 Tax=Ilyonectria robusta TaxID=1079257 RepID=UPI001E8DCE32|nr:uncharacterized protein BGZ61DRAFT_72120 [Ilyonectria robusta]KAH8676957.1 hypothetical protein BGZ61DRAFT_72120 [Ilyonectria robusta]
MIQPVLISRIFIWLSLVFYCRVWLWGWLCLFSAFWLGRYPTNDCIWRWRRESARLARGVRSGFCFTVVHLGSWFLFLLAGSIMKMRLQSEVMANGWLFCNGCDSSGLGSSF